MLASNMCNKQSRTSTGGIIWKKPVSYGLEWVGDGAISIKNIIMTVGVYEEPFISSPPTA